MNRNDLRRVDMNLLVIFEALMFEKNLTRVAEKLFIGQPAVSAALGRLRDLFDDPLLLRNGRAMEPTARALAILKELQPAMDTISGAVSRAKDFDPSTSCAVFRIGLSDDAEFGLFPSLLSRLREEAPGIIVVVRRANYLLMSSLLASGEISVDEQNGDLVTGEPREAAARAEAVAQAPGEADQQFVAGLVTEAVVDPLEVVDVHQQQADRRIAVAGEALIEIADEGRTVAEVGQVVGIGQALDTLLRQFGLGDVFVDADVMRQLTVVAIDLGNRQLPPVGFEVFPAALEFTLPAVALGQRRGRVE